MSPTVVRTAPALWLLVLLCTLFAVALVHGAEGASTHTSHGPARHHVAHEDVLHPSHGASGTVEEHGAAPEAGCAVARDHAHADCLSVAAAPFVLLVPLALAHPLAPPSPASPPRARDVAVPWAFARGLRRRRRVPRLLAELSVLRV
ncbi:hypothetical protein KIK06_05850 [Nocardiopsis sp. EMB25]|uniref:hypothetical protein n=1 Tax=Nocardiopsis TaxID=2013 RepID=UPI0003477756|nr:MULTISPECIES: hypothetical protein [Nocardiopsis]MCY9783418.1 hypothetical protein [Nocardiopsis sp. EMB25]